MDRQDKTRQDNTGQDKTRSGHAQQCTDMKQIDFMFDVNCVEWTGTRTAASALTDGGLARRRTAALPAGSATLACGTASV